MTELPRALRAMPTLPSITPLATGGRWTRQRGFDATVIAPAGQLTPADEPEETAAIRTVGARGAILTVQLVTPRENDGTPTGEPQHLSVYSELGAEDELDLAGALDLRDQVAALASRLDAMISALQAAAPGA